MIPEIHLHLTLKERPTDIIVPPLLEKGFTIREEDGEECVNDLKSLIEYFTTPPEERDALITKWFTEDQSKGRDE